MDEWVRAAMDDDLVVAELLFRLKQSQAASPSPKSHPPSVLPFSWGLKQTRSKLPSASRFEFAVKRRKKDGDSTRCSPTTPLSWSGGASPSATTDGFDESSSKPASLSQNAAGSKPNVTSEPTSNTSSTATKRGKRKKTYAELREEESSLLKERTYLRKELETMQATYKEQKTRNENLKRMNRELCSNSPTNARGTLDGLLQRHSSAQNHSLQLKTESALHCGSPSIIPTQSTADNDHLLPDYGEANRAHHSSRDNAFLVPDLNMAPSEHESISDTFYGIG